jgi:hypothetical protein
MPRPHTLKRSHPVTDQWAVVQQTRDALLSLENQHVLAFVGRYSIRQCLPILRNQRREHFNYLPIFLECNLSVSSSGNLANLGPLR